MATASVKATPSNSTSELQHTKVLIPYLIGIGSQVPLLLLYFRMLWGKSHYQFFPIALLSLAAFIFLRWPRSKFTFQRTWLTNTLLVVGGLFGVAAALYVEPKLAALCAVCLTASLLGMVPDTENNKSLMPIALLGLICITPLHFDQSLITWLQQVSARITSLLLDLVGYAHHMPGTVILAPGKKGFGIEEACSGVQSFFTLLFVASFFIVYFRRPWFRSVVLMASIVFWAIFMNTLRIITIPLADKFFSMDLAHGLPHDLLGYSTLFLGILMVYSTDQFLLFLFGPTDRFGDEGRGMLTFVGEFWNRVISGEDRDERKRKNRKTISQRNLIALWSVVGLLGLAGLWSLTDVLRSLYTTDLKIRFFDSNMVVKLAEDSLPSSLGDGDWKLSGYTVDDRSRGSDLGQFSNTWSYLAPQYRAIASFDQPFPGWHELTTCYRHMGWEIVTRRRIDGETADGKPWSYIAAELKNPVGQHGYLVFALFDSFGEPFDAPENYSSVQWFINGATNRLSNRIRGRLFRGEGYQYQLFVAQYTEIPDETQSIMKERFLETRELIRADFLKRRAAGVDGAGVDGAGVDAAGVDGAANSQN